MLSPSKNQHTFSTLYRIIFFLWNHMFSQSGSATPSQHGEQNHQTYGDASNLHDLTNEKHIFHRHKHINTYIIYIYVQVIIIIHMFGWGNYYTFFLEGSGLSKSQRRNPRTPWLYVGELLAREIGRLVAMEVRSGGYATGWPKSVDFTWFHH